MWPEEGQLPRRCWPLLLDEAGKQNLRITAPPHPCTPSRFAKRHRPLLLQATGRAAVNIDDAQQLLDEMSSRKAGPLNQRWTRTSLGRVLLAFDEDYEDCCC